MAKREAGTFITLEGPDGSGKSTQLRLLAEALRCRGLYVTETREPGGHPLAEQLRRVLLEHRDHPPGPEAELLLFLAARAQHVCDVIRPALRRGEVVLCERFSDSTLAYQVGGRGLPEAFVRVADRFATQGLKPTLTLLLDIPPAAGLSRAFAAKRGHDRMESQSAAFVRRVRRAYLEAAKREPGRIRVIRADRPLEAVSKSLWAIVQDKLGLVERGGRGV